MTDSTVSDMGIRRFLLIVSALTVLAQTAVAQTPPLIASVGKLIRDEKSDCSAVLIGPNLVLTAGHCLSGRKLITEGGEHEIRFQTGAYPGHPAKEFRAVARAIHPLFRASGQRDRTGAGTDIGLLQLAEDVPETTARPIPIGEPLAEGDKAILATYPGGAGPRARERSCTVEERVKAQLRLLCTVRPGESGGAVLSITDNGPTVSGVVFASAKDGRQPYAFAVDVPARLMQLRAVSGF